MGLGSLWHVFSLPPFCPPCLSFFFPLSVSPSLPSPFLLSLFCLSPLPPFLFLSLAWPTGVTKKRSPEETKEGICPTKIVPFHGRSGPFFLKSMTSLGAGCPVDKSMPSATPWQSHFLCGALLANSKTQLRAWKITLCVLRFGRFREKPRNQNKKSCSSLKDF